MSDAALIIIVPSLVSTIGLIVIAWLNNRGNKRNKEEIVAKVDNVVAKVDETVSKVEGYHKEVNGKMEKLLEAKEALGREKGKAEEKTKK